MKSSSKETLYEEYRASGATVLDTLSGDFSGMKGYTFRGLTDIVPSEYEDLVVKFDDGSHFVKVKGVSVIEEENGKICLLLHM